MQTLLPGITAERLPTSRLTAAVLSVTGRTGEPVLCDPSGAGSGGGSVNPDFVARLSAGDRSSDSPTSPRQVLLAHYVKPPFVPAEIDIFVESILSTRTGDDHYSGTAAQVPDWPGFAPGDRGVLNTMAPTTSGSPAWRRSRPSRRSCGCGARTT
jgi:hypothetical protein